MDGVQGLSGWRWLYVSFNYFEKIFNLINFSFIWNGIITVIIAAAGFLLVSFNFFTKRYTLIFHTFRYQIYLRTHTLHGCQKICYKLPK